MARSLGNADSDVIRFLIGIALGEYVLFWGSSHDGSGVRNALKRLAGVEPGAQIWGTTFASALANCEAMKVVDGLTIYSPMGEKGPHPLLTFEAMMKTPSDITKWRTKGEGGRPQARTAPKGLPQWAGPVEMPELPERASGPSRSLPAPVVAAEPSPRSLRRAERKQSATGLMAGPVAAATPPDPFLAGFHRVAKEMLSAVDFAALEEMAKGVGDV